MRVAFVTVGETGRLTGGYLYHARLFAGLRQRGVTVEEVVPCGASPEEQAEAAPRLGRLLDPASFDVMVVDALARIVCAPHLDRWRETVPVVAMVHELPSVAASGSSPEQEMEREGPLLRSDLLIAVSKHGASVLVERGVPVTRVRVVEPGFDRLPRPGADGLAKRGSGVRVLCVAQWIPRKGILELVRAWTLRERPNAALELVGETDADPAYAALVHEAARDAPAGSVVVGGPIPDAALADAYAAADVFALPSRYEGYGIVYAEALAHGLPVIACDVGPVADLVGAEAALLVPPDDPAALSAAIDRLLGDAVLRRRMAEAALLRAEGLPRWDDTATRSLSVLREAVAERAVRRGPIVGREDLREQNRRSWNAVVGAHDSHRGDLAAFFRGGGSTLFPEERALLGQVVGKSVLHLQCNSGADSLSLAQLGATVTGVDISDRAISSARRLSEASGVPAGFERADVYAWLEDASRRGRRFDAVFSSYGVVCWLSDLGAWAAGIAAVLGSGGRFVLVDFHPAAEMFDESWRPVRDYPSGGEPVPLDEGVGDYVGDSGGGLTPAGFVEGVRGFENPEPAHLFRWGLGEIITALAGAGLRVKVLEEYPYLNGERAFAGMREERGRRMAPPGGRPPCP